MCGRFVVARVGSELAGVLRADVVADDLPAPSFNIAPTARAAIVLDSAKTEPPTRRIAAARWGLVPPWAKDPSIGSRAFNARSEEAADKPMFRGALAARRAVIPASGYYEWRTDAGGKTPFYIRPEADEPLLLAGLYEWWKDDARAADDPQRWLLSFTILTRDAVGELGSIHDRMPLFIDADHADVWLDPTTEYAGDLLDAVVDAAPARADELIAVPVGKAVGNVRNDDPSLIDPVDGTTAATAADGAASSASSAE
ncbi:SOS response-associated peptidase [Microbacterium radiodurans]|uniref:Abasic site processing protein n=1 Tax=Microbacterium radiodurans TaxID=661398 RepID=A0A5J5IQC5_9MICO|nr:SOS response-associated peptidase [Microbacterium radiodurans]KAA9086796.1 SOS response-associated peptidase [Microbacterium radiodurans]